MMVAWLTHWFRVSPTTPHLNSEPSEPSSFPTLLIVPGMLLHLFIIYAHALFLPYLSIMPSSVPLQRRCTTSRSCIPSSCLCFLPLYAFFGRSALRTEFSGVVCMTKYILLLLNYFCDDCRYTQVRPTRKTECMRTSARPASPETGSPVMSFAYLISRACRRSWQPKNSEGGIPELPRGAPYETLSWTRQTTSVLNQYADPPSTEDIGLLRVPGPARGFLLSHSRPAGRDRDALDFDQRPLRPLQGTTGPPRFRVLSSGKGKAHPQRLREMDDVVPFESQDPHLFFRTARDGEDDSEAPRESPHDAEHHLRHSVRHTPA